MFLFCTLNNVISTHLSVNTFTASILEICCCDNRSLYEPPPVSPHISVISKWELQNNLIDLEKPVTLPAPTARSSVKLIFFNCAKFSRVESKCVSWTRGGGGVSWESIRGWKGLIRVCPTVKTKWRFWGRDHHCFQWVLLCVCSRKLAKAIRQHTSLAHRVQSSKLNISSFLLDKEWKLYFNCWKNNGLFTLVYLDAYYLMSCGEFIIFINERSSCNSLAGPY